MARIAKLPALLPAVLVLCAVTPGARADLHLVALDGSDKTVKPEQFGYKGDMYRSGKGNKCLTIRLVLTEEAARSFRFGQLTLTKGEQTVVETTLGLIGIQKTADNKRLLTVTFAAE